MGHLAGGINVEVGVIGDHASKQCDIDGVRLLEDLLDCFGVKRLIVTC